MRANPAYYRIYITLRGDGAYKLISYPYYTKYTRATRTLEENLNKLDSTYFRHINISVPDYVSLGKGKN